MPSVDFAEGHLGQQKGLQSAQWVNDNELCKSLETYTLSHLLS